MSDISELLGQSTKGQEDTERQFAQWPDVATHLQFFDEDIVTVQTATKLETRNMGSSFVLGDPTYGKLGPSLTPQPYLGACGVSAFSVVINQSTGSPFTDFGKTQLRDWLIGSATAVAPAYISLGSGTSAWIAASGSLQYRHASVSASRYGEGVQLGSFQAIVSSIDRTGNGSYTEAGIGWANGSVFTRDTFPLVYLASGGSEMRVTMSFRVGS